jgi:8-amino-7-oxononanoate synthase
MDWREVALADIVRDLEARHLARARRTVEQNDPARGGVRVRIDGRWVLNFCSNDYLGLAQHPALRAAFVAAAERHGVGSGASHLVTGHHHEHQALEEELAAFTGREAALLFSTGYMANLAIGATFAGRQDQVFEDRLNHASLIDAGRLAGARLQRYPHLDATALEAQLTAFRQQSPRAQALVLTDGVFSMEGDVAPLPAIAAACDRHRAWLAVDDAHGFGVLGASGAGSVEAAGLDATAVPILIGTLGKACGSFGAFAAGSRGLIEVLLQSARTYIYTTALPPAVAAATRAALRVVAAEPWRREHVLALAARFRTAASALGFRLPASTTPIQSLLVGAPEAALALSKSLFEKGFMVSAIRPPTVPARTARLRVTFSAAHTEADVTALLEALADLAPHAAVA